jgi:hypothetical protein
MRNIKILHQAREIGKNEIVFREHTNFNPNSSSALEIIEFIENHTDVRFEWISNNELVGSSGAEIGLRIIKKKKDENN